MYSDLNNSTVGCNNVLCLILMTDKKYFHFLIQLFQLRIVCIVTFLLSTNADWLHDDLEIEFWRPSIEIRLKRTSYLIVNEVYNENGYCERKRFNVFKTYFAKAMNCYPSELKEIYWIWEENKNLKKLLGCQKSYEWENGTGDGQMGKW